MQWLGDDDPFEEECPYKTPRLYVVALGFVLAAVTIGGFLIRYALSGTPAS